MEWVGDLAAWAWEGVAGALAWLVGLVGGLLSGTLATYGSTIGLVLLIFYVMWLTGMIGDGDGKGGKR